MKKSRIFRGLKVRSVANGVVLAGVVFASVGCVVLKRDYDALQSQLEAEQQARKQAYSTIEGQYAELRRLNEQLAAAKQQIAAQAATVTEQQAALGKQGQTLAEVELQVALVEQRHLASQQMVGQLRAELDRVSKHLRVFAADRDKLGQERQALAKQLELTEQRLAELVSIQDESAFQVKVVRALATELHGSLKKNLLHLDVTRQFVELRVRSSRVFAPRSGRITREGRAMLADLGRAFARLPGSVEIGETIAPNEPSAAMARLRGIAEQLAASGVPHERVSFQLPTSKATAPDKKTARAKKTAAQLLFRLRASVTPTDS